MRKAIKVNLMKQSKQKKKKIFHCTARPGAFTVSRCHPGLKRMIFYKPLICNFETFEAGKHHVLVSKSFQAAKAGTYENMGGGGGEVVVRIEGLQ